MGRVAAISIGNIFGRLLVLERDEKSPRNRINWICRCCCGKVVSRCGQDLRRGDTRSCGCLVKEVTSSRASLPDGEAGLHALYNTYKKNAKAKNRPFDLAEQDFQDLTSGQCFYCGVLPSQLMQPRGVASPYFYNGIDRINNELGYIFGNLVSCCFVCNRAKGNMPYVTWVEYLQRLSNYQQ